MVIKKLGQRRILKWIKIKLNEAIPQTPTESASDQHDKPKKNQRRYANGKRSNASSKRSGEL